MAQRPVSLLIFPRKQRQSNNLPVYVVLYVSEKYFIIYYTVVVRQKQSKDMKCTPLDSESNTLEKESLEM